MTVAVAGGASKSLDEAQYKPHIDGLRALAVSLVVCSHAGMPGMPGGFIGVDVFFVISGYLITLTIAREMQLGTFSFRRFYARRARRLLPALFFVLGATLLAGVAILLPSELRELGYSATATLLFVANFYFMDATGYFAENARSLPLLHTWSLSVEEQFYLAFPVLLFGAARLRRPHLTTALIVVLALVSLLLSQWGADHKPQANYFFTPSRAWELLAGSVAARVSFAWVPRKLAGAGAIIGTLLILCSAFAFDQATPHPSLLTTVPVLGACLVLVLARQDGLVGRIMVMRPLVLIGLSSYSIYLFHQPVLAYALVLGVPSSPVATAVLLALITVLGIASWRYVEQPFRHRSDHAPNPTSASPSLSMVVFSGLTIASLALSFTSLPHLFVAPSNKTLLAVEWRESRKYLHNAAKSFIDADFSREDRPRILIVGDSFAKDLLNALQEAKLTEQVAISFHQIGSECGNLFIESTDPAIVSLGLPSECARTGRYESTDLRRRMQEADTIILASLWYPWVIPLLPRSVTAIRGVSDARILVVGTKSMGQIDLRQMIATEPSLRTSLRLPIDPAIRDMNATMGGMFGDDFLDIQGLICPDSAGCPAVNPAGQPLSCDGMHLTRAGAKLLASRLTHAPFVDVIKGIK